MRNLNSVDVYPNKVVVFKTVSGEEVIGRITDIGNDYLVVENVRSFTLMPNEATGQYAITMVPSVMSSPKAKIEFDVASIAAWVVDVPAELEKRYISQTSSIDLQTPLSALKG